MHNSHARTGANAVGAGGNHRLYLFQRTNTAGSFDFRSIAYGPTTQLYIFYRSAAAAKACGGFYEMRAPSKSRQRRLAFFVIIQKASYQDGFDNFALRRLYDAMHIVGHPIPLAALRRP